MAWTTTDLLAALRRRGRLPDGDPSDADLLLDASTALRTDCLTTLRTLREGYGLIQQDVALVADRATYVIPSRALSGTVDDVQYVDSTGRCVGNVPNVPVHEIEQRSEVGAWSTDSGYVFALRGGNVILSPTPRTGEGGSLRFTFQEDPGTLVAESRGAQVTIAAVAGGMTGFNVDSTAAFGSAGTVNIDVRDGSGGGSARVAGDLATWDASDEFVLNAEHPDIRVGDWVTLAGETVAIPIPDVMMGYLVAATLVYVHDGLGHDGEVARMERLRDRELAAARQLLEPRTREAKRIVNPHSALRGGPRYWR